MTVNRFGAIVTVLSVLAAYGITHLYRRRFRK
jgi:hypothetical protein